MPNPLPFFQLGLLFSRINSSSHVIPAKAGIQEKNGSRVPTRGLGSPNGRKPGMTMEREKRILAI